MTNSEAKTSEEISKKTIKMQNKKFNIVVLFIVILSTMNVVAFPFYVGDHKLNSSEMEYLLYNTNLEIVVKNKTISDIVGDFQLSRKEGIYDVTILKTHNKTYKQCLVMWFLREHPEILQAFPDIENKDSINLLHIGGKSCLHASGSSNVANGGGGGGGIVVTNIYDSVSHFWQLVKPNEKITLKSKSEDISITSIEVTNSNKELKNAELEVQALIQNKVSQEPEEKVYQYLRVNTNINIKDARKIKINFQVSAKWIKEHSINDIVLMRFSDGEWIKLKTESSAEDFYALTDKFDLFAIVGIVKENLPSEPFWDIVEE